MKDFHLIAGFFSAVSAGVSGFLVAFSALASNTVNSAPIIVCMISLALAMIFIPTSRRMYDLEAETEQLRDERDNLKAKIGELNHFIGTQKTI
ncbi:MAG: hypothetical protein A3B99_05475 [Candidatus Yanofskybacteria bacterium RIFCSPHIGHO2_02_FULL_44_12b]|uniref:Uncharacterized protein n=2 Tax=Candidatus Yanofskyibacteriota TaxID=1752733 RepID=A0A1F8GLC6_9BACT|nr:MAG: hypothetical protein UW79_C0028G0003 [Candidatus Yanofskybacteria bacterium GW2011_GWA2_44_9]OGN05158.1 MAG: hypothetical protein A2659_02370 [Candidatus Yanofskybacteria bacterium RIFCSPHIGHO2_01_FULL_44_24]OGN14592.1 MAG: hypothetical protein A3B99_05475 [Candidatus Yanofskybacteria bacterium RIFCSPHIGHO2_02_FULL_44_12b]OGN25466.1 MAG: hypothetical protein A2925_01910 [Candidatus Yanofskybacteria bacterium RIFCSPLOWO2_01_FULL_44_22]